MNPRQAASLPLVLSLFAAPVLAQRAVPPYDLWNDKVLAEIKDRGTLSHIAAGSRFTVSTWTSANRKPRTVNAHLRLRPLAALCSLYLCGFTWR